MKTLTKSEKVKGLKAHLIKLRAIKNLPKEGKEVVKNRIKVVEDEIKYKEAING